MAGSTTYPGSVDNKTALQDGVDIIQADDVNDAYVPIDAIETFVGGIGSGKTQSSSTDMLDYLGNEKAPMCSKASGSTITVSAGAVVIKNSGQSNRMLRRTTSDITVSASNLDTGSMVVGYYYIYAVADTAATTFTVKFSASASSPTGLTNYELIGWFYNQANGSLDITIDYVGNVKRNGRDVPNVVKIEGTTDISTASTSLTDMTTMEIRIYSSGRPMNFVFTAPFIFDTIVGTVVIDIDGATKKTMVAKWNFGVGNPLALHWTETLSAGTHTIKIRWKVSSGTGYQSGSTEGSRLLTATEE